jgi:cell division septum initiation protein DivIVA
MSEHSELLSDLGQEDLFEREMRGYSRRRVDEFVARNRSQIRDLEDRLSQTLDDNEQLRIELAAVRQDAADKPAHEEISERVGQILRLAEEEAKAQRNRSQDEINKLREVAKQDTDKLRSDAKQDTDKVRAEAQEQAERMLSAAQEQAERSVATARTESDKMRNATRTEAERVVAEANKHAENAVAAAKTQAKQQLDEATARATAIHDGAERRLNLLMSRHTEAIRRLTEIRDVVTTLVAGETSRGSMEDEVNKAVAGVLGHQPTTKQGGAPDGRHSAQATAPAPRAGGTPVGAVPSPSAQGAPAMSPQASAAAGRSRTEQEAAKATENRAEHGAANGTSAGRPAPAAPAARPGNGSQPSAGTISEPEPGPGRPGPEGTRHGPSGSSRAADDS